MNTYMTQDAYEAAQRRMNRRWNDPSFKWALLFMLYLWMAYSLTGCINPPPTRPFNDATYSLAAIERARATSVTTRDEVCYRRHQGWQWSLRGLGHSGAKSFR